MYYKSYAELAIVICGLAYWQVISKTNKFDLSYFST